jgi:putative glutathione S-transferase
MGIMIEGKWHIDDPARTDAAGRFVRRDTSFRNWVTADGKSGYPAEAGRYHLYVSLACPWAHRTLILRKVKGLEPAISLSVVSYVLGDDGWSFDNVPGTVPDSVNGARFLREVYLKADPAYTGRVSVPVLWDKRTGTIVNNESREIVRMFDTEFNALAANQRTLLPPELKAQVDETITINQEQINNGVYRCGFAKSQAAYDEAVGILFAALERCEAILGRQRYLCGERLTEADWCLFPTLARFDPVYVTHFKCNVRRIVDYPNLWNYTKELYQLPGVAKTVNLEHIKRHYFGSHPFINPTGIVPQGPAIDFSAPHDRARKSFAA